ncbi:MAG: phytoene desaturase [Spirochaetaceae bacterium]|nr:phytoene desaturase [Spirochaetaceae bacterium]
MTAAAEHSARVAVIGSGFGGLAAAIRLQAAGLATTLFEAREQPGGRAYVWRHRGFTFDMGPTVITDPTLLEDLFAVAGANLRDRVELLPVDPFYRLLWPDGDRFDYCADGAALAAQIGRRNPDDRDGYRRFLDYSRRVFATGYEELAATPFLRFWDMVRVAPQLAGLRADRSVYRTVARYIGDERIREALSFHTLLVGGNPFETSAIYTLIHYLERRWGVFYPRGGVNVLVRALVRLFVDLGGRLLLASPVQHATLAGAAGRTVHHLAYSRAGSGHREPFDAVVSNADVHHTYAVLYRGTPAAARRQTRLQRAAWSMSLFVLYFGTDRDYRGQVVHHSVLFGPRYRELLADIFHGARLPEDFSLYLHAPHITDPSLAPPGHGAFYVLAPVPHLGNAALEWDHVAPHYADRILADVERVLPDVRRHIVVRRWMTPLDFRSELNAYQGSAFSLAPTLTQSAWFRTHNRDSRIDRLYLVGAGTHPGAGIPGVINSARATAHLVLEDLAP